MAVKFWVPLASATLNGGAINVSPLNKQTTGDVDETDRVSNGAAGEYTFTLSGSPAAVTTSHGGITSIKMHFRIYYSNNGPVALNVDNYQPHVAPFITVDGNTYYNLPDTAVVVGAQSNLGYAYGDYVHNFNLAREPVARVCEWAGIQSLVSWDNTKLSNCVFGLVQTGVYLGSSPYRYTGWAPDTGGGGNTPRVNITQCILEVDATDPPPPPTKGMVLNA